MKNNIGEAATIGESAESATETGTDRVWREGASPREYTWTPQSFSGFFYDLKNNAGTERLTVRLQPSGRSIDSGDLKYSTEAQDTDFEFGGWGSYRLIGFMGEKYIAGYNAGYNAGDISATNRSLINDGQIRKVLIDSDNESTLSTGSALPLEEGYELRIGQVHPDGNKVYISLAKDGVEVDSKAVSPEGIKSSTYEYEVNIKGKKFSLVLAHISNIFCSTESDLVTVNGLFQISDTYYSVEEGDEYDNMKVTSISDQGVEMENRDSLSLGRGNTTMIIGNIGFQVADADVLRFAPMVQRTGTYDVRGTVIDPSLIDEFTWTPYNFEWFYYDIDDDVGTETLRAKISGGNKIFDKDLIYTTSPQIVKFKFGNWGKYNVIGFMGEKYFAGYHNETAFTDAASAINEVQLRKVLLDSDDSQTIASGSAFPLEEGYELRIGQVHPDGNKVNLSLARDGVEVDSNVVNSSPDPKDRASNYIYKVDIGSEKDVPMITAHVQSIFQSTESGFVTFDAVFQVSDNPVSVEDGKEYGIMKVESIGSDGITMINNGTINLSRGEVIDIMGNLKLEVADKVRRLLAPVATKTVEEMALSLNVPEAMANEPAIISARSGNEALSGVKVSINGSHIGITDVSGSISYTPSKAGTFQLVARKTGNNDAAAKMVVGAAAEAPDQSAIQEANP